MSFRDNFHETSQLSCKYGSLNAKQLIWISLHYIICMSPPSLSGNVHLNVSSNSMDYSHDDSIHEYVAIPYIISIHPNHGSTSGGTTILLEGTNFLFSETLSCSFGNETSQLLARHCQIE